MPGEMDAVLADDAHDIVTFDVPPAHDGRAASTPIARRGRHCSPARRRAPDRVPRRRPRKRLAFANPTEQLAELLLQ
jgi:hypothetical protein